MFVYGIFAEEEAASNAVQQLIDADFPSDAIRAGMQRGEEAEELPVEGRTSAGRGLVVGGVLGVLIGAIVAVAADLVGPPAWLAAIKGALVGGGAGVVLGGLLGMVFWREEVDFLHRRLKQGDVIVGVETNPERRASAEEALRAAGAREVQVRREQVALEQPIGQ